MTCPKPKTMLPLILAALLAPGFLCSCETPGRFAVTPTKIADKVWAFSQSHPDGFTLDVFTMTEPKEGIAVSYAATQDSHSREQVDKVLEHALRHDGYVGGWPNAADGLYYFDSTRLFPEDALDDSVRFGKENGQHAVFVLSTSTGIPVPTETNTLSPP